MISRMSHRILELKQGQLVKDSKQRIAQGMEL
jgi:hypothetical protein